MLENEKILKFTFISLFLLGMIGYAGILACGGNNTEKESDTQAASKTEQVSNEANSEADEKRFIEIEGLDTLKFSLTEITAKPGEEITVKLINNSSLPPNVMSHNFVLLKKSANPGSFNEAVLANSTQGSIPENMTDQVIADTGLVAGGESKSVTFTVPSEPGEYTYICTFPGHLSAGMKGTLTVK